MHCRLSVVSIFAIGCIVASSMCHPASAMPKRSGKAAAVKPTSATPKKSGKAAPAKPNKPVEHKTPTPPKKETLKPDQRNAIEAALKALRKFGTATEVGVSASEYRNRLIDLKADVAENQRLIPDGKTQSDITDAIQAYQDALTFWNECTQLVYRHDIKNGESGPILTKYGLILPDNGKFEKDAFDREKAEWDQLDKEYKEHLNDAGFDVDANLKKCGELTESMGVNLFKQIKINDSDEKNILSQIWSLAAQKEKDAEATLK